MIGPRLLSIKKRNLRIITEDGLSLREGATKVKTVILNGRHGGISICARLLANLLASLHTFVAEPRFFK